jgi:hypothetical protein
MILTDWTMGLVLFVFAGTSFFILPSDDLEHVEGSKPIFDFAGTITGVTGLVLINFAWNQAAVVGWAVPYTYVLLIVGLVFMGLFVYVEMYLAEYPLVPIKNLSKEAVYAISIIACGWSSFGIWVFYLWQLVENLRHHSVLSSAAQQIPVAFSGLVASLLVGVLLSKVKVAFIMVAAMACFLTGQILIATAPVSQTYWAQTFISLLIMPWGMDMSFPAATIIISNGLPREHQGSAASLINTVVNYSISISLGVAGTIVRQTNDSGKEVLEGYRNAWYFAIGLDGFGMAIALYFFWVSVVKEKAVA